VLRIFAETGNRPQSVSDGLVKNYVLHQGANRFEAAVGARLRANEVYRDATICPAVSSISINEYFDDATAR
jgi:hypothetical protein